MVDLFDLTITSSNIVNYADDTVNILVKQFGRSKKSLSKFIKNWFEVKN